MKLFVAARVVGRLVRVVVVNASVVEMAIAAIAVALQILFIVDDIVLLLLQQYYGLGWKYL